ncbi:VCBS repeat-containing protein [Streptomyces sp. RS10V-4]|uniref:FG-GAP repeat domain-containing protein n=1 Tax=Streptomyces rhizoryzae TaxID=2932493 RepID=UPI00200567DE|nr:VCBS repeat-containing protein [Streptomyces rhizoryzae]MCK7621784.1 VCBS repeat-containing protein [Streptomyces rhizoryzae]
MASAHTTRRRLGAAVATVLAVTVGAGVLAAPGAVAAPASVVAAAAAPADAPAAPATLPVGADIVSSGETGYLTTRKDEAGHPVLEWRTYADGSVTPITDGTVGYESDTDTVVTGDGGTTFYLRDMTDGAAPTVSFDLAAEFKPGAKLVGVVGGNLFVSVPTTADYHELWQLSQVDGATKKTQLSGSNYSLDYKVVASNGFSLLILGKSREISGPTFQTVYWKAATSVTKGAVIDMAGRQMIGPWTANSTASYPGDYTAWTEYGYSGREPQIVVSKPGLTKRFPLDSSLSGAVIAGITDDTLLYGVPGSAGGETLSPLYARSITKADAEPYKLLEHFSSVAHAPDSSLRVRGATADADGLFSIAPSGLDQPRVALVAGTGRSLAVKVADSKVPTAVNLETPGTTVPMEWTLSRPNATVDLTLTHTATGKTLTQRLPQPVNDSRFRFVWDGLLDGISAPNGAYTWQITATPADGIGGPATGSGSFQVTREANPHDFNDNGSTDVLARDASGVLWRDDLFDWPSGGQVATAKRTRIGAGWQIYNQVTAVGNVAGAPTGDLVARDGSGVLWLYLGKGDGTFAPRLQVGGGWQIYNTITAGSDLTGDGRPDLLATDTSGVLWLYKGTGSWSAPFAPRVKVGGGWQIYHQITAVGNLAGSAAGDLVARDTSGVLWLYQGNGAGGFSPRVKIGAGWNAFSHLVGAGDVTADGRPDLIAYGASGTYVYRSTGSATAPFSRQTTTLYAGEGTTFNSVV